MRIGEVLEQARDRAGLEIADVEEQTKIRAKYLRALETEELGRAAEQRLREGLSAHLRQLLGLDADALVDEYRRQVESELSEPSYPLGDQVLERRRRPGGRRAAGRSRTAIVIGLIVLIAAGVGAAILITKRRRAEEARRQARQGRQEARQAQARRRRQGQAGRPGHARR